MKTQNRTLDGIEQILSAYQKGKILIDKASEHNKHDDENVLKYIRQCCELLIEDIEKNGHAQGEPK